MYVYLRQNIGDHKELLSNLYFFLRHDQNLNIKKIYQSGGSIKTFIIDDNELRVNIKKIQMDADNKKNLQLNIVTLDENEDICAMMLVYGDDQTGVIQDIFNYKTCISNKKGYDDLKIGTKLLKILISLAKELKLKKIELTDNSQILCGKIKINLIDARTLTNGYPWYLKFGFKSKDKNVNKQIIDNYNKIKNVKTKDIDLTDLINSTIKKYDIKRDYSNIKNYINTNQEKLLMGTMRFILEKECKLFDLLWQSIFYKLDIRSITKKSFYKKLKK